MLAVLRDAFSVPFIHAGAKFSQVYHAYRVVRYSKTAATVQQLYQATYHYFVFFQTWSNTPKWAF